MRADKFFSEKFSSRTKAAEALKKGYILRGGKPVSPSDEVNEDDVFEFLEEEHFRYVSNGGYKLERAINEFKIDVSGMSFADLGSSTGGFCDCLLQNGARHVFCVDVGTSQLCDPLREDGRVTVMEGVNARFLTRESFSFPPDGVTADLSFISLKLVLPAISQILSVGQIALLLLKPQFECGREGLKKGGICPVGLHGKLLGEFYDEAIIHDLSPLDVVNAPIREKKNIEYMVSLKKGAEPLEKREFLLKASKLI